MKISWKIKKHSFCKLLQVMLLGILIMASASTKSYAAPNTEESVIAPPKTSINALDFKLLGYPVIEDHYQEWKTAFGYNGVDNIDYEQRVVSANFGDLKFANYSDGKDFKIGYDSRPYLKWIEERETVNNPTGYIIRSFVVNLANADYVSEDWQRVNFQYVLHNRTILDGPITPGMSFDEVLQVLGCDQAISVLTVEGSQDKLVTYTIADGVTVQTRISMNSPFYIRELVFVDNPNLTVIEIDGTVREGVNVVNEMRLYYAIRESNI